MTQPVTAIIGVGPGNGLAFAQRFSAEGHRVGLLSRSLGELEKWAGELGGGAGAFACDASDPNSVEGALKEVAEQLGPVDHLLYNAGSGMFGSVDEVAFDDLEKAWRINALGLFSAAKAVLPSMRKRGSGSIIVTGATASLRGGANFLAFAQAKAAQRNLTQSLARKVGADGVHVALVIVDGMIASDRARVRMPDAPDEAFLRAEDIADAVWFLSQQHRSAWTFELDLRPFSERW